LLAVDEQRVRSRERVAGGLVEVAEQGEASVFQRARAVLVLAVEARDKIVDELRDGGVLADNDEAGRHTDVAGDKFTVGVVGVWVIGLENAQPIFDREPWCDDEKPATEASAVGATHSVDRLPGNQHRHHGRFSGAGGQFQRKTHQLGIGVLVGCGQMRENALAALGFQRDNSSEKSDDSIVLKGRK
jgi:hypothetical protein